MNSYDHETDVEYEEMKRVEKSILDHYAAYMEEYDPMADGLFDSWNWDTKELDCVVCLKHAIGEKSLISVMRRNGYLEILAR